MKKKMIPAFMMAFMSMTGNTQDKAIDFRQPYALGQQLQSEHFSGAVWLSKLSNDDSLNVPMFNVTFEPGCINAWHYHTGGQILVASAGTGYYQEKGKPARRLHPGDIVEIAPNVVHWHGAAPDSWFAHVAASPNAKTNNTVWLQPVDREEYVNAVKPEAVDTVLLTSRDRSIISVAACTGMGDLNGLRVSLAQALDAGMSVNELKEILIHAYAYCGFPRSLRAIQTLMELTAERKNQGIQDKEGREASPVNQSGDKYARGRQVLEQLTGITANTPPTGYAAFAPTIDRFLKEHLFADIFERDLLTYREREFATVAILASLGNVEPMARGHLSICLHLGISPAQLTELFDIIEFRFGKTYSESMYKVLSQLTSTIR